jgi:hypothetical protein
MRGRGYLRFRSRLLAGEFICRKGADHLALLAFLFVERFESRILRRKTALRCDVDDQQNLDLQSLHRVRERWVGRRTAVINQIRGMLLERGITVTKGRRHIGTKRILGRVTASAMASASM